jgi:magnesium and cobalt transporter
MDLILTPPESAGLGSCIRRPFYVPEAGRLDALLDEFRRRGHELAVVVDEHGGASGIVTLEDVLEEMVGEILDEFDDPQRDLLQSQGESVFVVEGKARLGDLSDRLGVTLPRVGYETLAGFLAHRLQRIPRAGDRVEFGGLSFTVTEASERRVRKVRIEAPGGDAGPEP